MHIRRALLAPCLAFAFLVGASVIAPSPSSAQAPAADAPTTEAERFIRDFHERVATLAAPNRARRSQADVDRALDGMVAGLIDYDELARRSLAAHWETRNEAERREFLSLFRQLIEKSYRRNLGTTANYEVRYVGQEQRADSIVVKTVSRSRTRRRSPEVRIDYTLRRVGQSFRVFDVTTDDVSLVRNYRNQFNRIITRDGWPALLERMRSRLAGPGASDL